VNLSGFLNCLAEYTRHRLSPCYGLPTALGLLNSVARWCKYNTIFHKNVAILHACVHEHRKEFFQRGTSGLFQKFFCGGPKVVKFDFYHSKLRKQRFLLKFSNSCPPSDTHACVEETFVPHH